jgi:Proteasome stabiliser
MEEDLANVASMDHPKMKALEQIISHLMMRVKNSPDVNPPWVALLQIFNDSQYNLPEANPWIKHHVSSRIFEFIFESFDRIPPSLDLEILGSILRS